MKLVYLVIGVPGSGKSWVCNQIKHKFEYVHHDGFIGHIKQPELYVQAIVDREKSSNKPILAEAPFSISQIKGPLESRGFKVIPLFIIEEPHIITERYFYRERKMIPEGHLTRTKTYKQKAIDWGAFSGTSKDVAQYLSRI